MALHSTDFNNYRFYTHIDVDTVDAILRDNVGLEIKWLKQVLDSSIKIMGHKGRPLSTKRFYNKIEELQHGEKEFGEETQQTVPEKPIDPIPSTPTGPGFSLWGV